MDTSIQFSGVQMILYCKGEESGVLLINGPEYTFRIQAMSPGPVMGSTKPETFPFVSSQNIWKKNRMILERTVL